MNAAAPLRADKDSADSLAITLTDVEYRNPVSHVSILKGTDTNGVLYRLYGTTDRPVRGEKFTAYGHFTRHSAYGQIFVFNHYVALPPEGAGHLTHYLTDICDLPSALAHDIARSFGNETLHILEDDHRRLLTVPGMDENLLERAMTAWRDNKRGDKVTALLKDHGIQGPSLKKLKTKMGSGDDIVQRIRSNPYLLYLYLDDISLREVENLIQNLGCHPEFEKKLLAVIMWALRSALARFGHTHMESVTVHRMATRRIGAEFKRNNAAFDKALRRLIKAGLIRRWEHSLALTDYAEAETRLADDLKRLASAERNHECSIESARIVRVLKAQLPEHAANALSPVIQHALHHKISLVTNLSHRDRVLCSAALKTIYEALGARVEVIACDTRTCDELSLRMQTECLTPEGIIGQANVGPPNYNRQSPMDCDAIIINQADQIDVIALQQLLDALPDKTALIMLGDRFARAPIGAGQPFIDMLACKHFSPVVLPPLHASSNTALTQLRERNLTGQAFHFSDLRSHPGHGQVLALHTDDLEQAQSITLQLYRETFPALKEDTVHDCMIAAIGNFEAVRRVNHYLQGYLNGDQDDIAPGIDVRIGDPVFYNKSTFNPYVPAGTRARLENVLPGDKLLLKLSNDSHVIVTGNDRRKILPAYIQPVNRITSGVYNTVVLMTLDPAQPVDMTTLHHCARMAKERLFVMGDPNSYGQAPSIKGPTRMSALPEALLSTFRKH